MFRPSRLLKPQRFRALALLWAFALFVVATLARAEDDPWLEPILGSAPEPLVTSPHELWEDASSGGPLWVSVQGSLVVREQGRRDFGAMLLVGVPLERLAKPSMRARSVGTEARFAETSATLDAAKAPPSSGPSEPQKALEPAPMPLLLTPEMAREAVKAALTEATLLEPFLRLDAIAKRARTSALLPELRLRVTRQLDQSQALSPTEYDPARVTASGGTSLWLEARATFRLDRLVFADEEVPLEKHRDERADNRKKLVDRVLTELFAWQRAMVARDDESKEPEERARAAIAVIEAEASLDVLTGGWFSKWRAAQKRRSAP